MILKVKFIKRIEICEKDNQQTPTCINSDEPEEGEANYYKKIMTGLEINKVDFEEKQNVESKWVSYKLFISVRNHVFLAYCYCNIESLTSRLSFFFVYKYH